MSVDSAEARGRGTSTTVDTSDQTLPTPGRKFVRYDGAVQQRHLLINVRSLNWMRCCTGSQWSSSCMVVAMWSNFRLQMISHAAAFNTDWS